MNEGIKFLERLLESYETIESKIRFLQLKERQTYHYYCDCGSNFTQEQDNEYHKTWDWIIDNLNRLEAEQAAGQNNMEEKKVNQLYGLLERAEKEKDTESMAALRWAIFTLEQKAG